MDGHVLLTFSDRILAVDTRVAQRCAARHVPDPRCDRDALIAATALVHDMTVVTRDVSPFQPIGVACSTLGTLSNDLAQVRTALANHRTKFAAHVP